MKVWTMGVRPGPISSREEIAERVQRLDLDILRQQKIIRELEDDCHPTKGAKILLRLMEEARGAMAEQIGPSS
jgi:hypothetical protein